MAETDVDCSLVAPPDLFPVLLTLTSTSIQQSKLTTFIQEEWAGWIIIYAAHSLSKMGKKWVGTRGRLRAVQHPISNLCQIVRLLHSHPLTHQHKSATMQHFHSPFLNVNWLVDLLSHGDYFERFCEFTYSVSPALNLIVKVAESTTN